MVQSTIEQLQRTLTTKDESIIQYETLLKKDRDEHSLAAARMQEEVKLLQEIIAAKEEFVLPNYIVSNPPTADFCRSNETAVEPQPGKPTAEEYVMQVSLLEEKNAQLDADVASLNAQLQTCKQEVVSWKDMANNRLEDLESLRKT